MAVHFSRERMQEVLDTLHHTPYFGIGFHASRRAEAERILALR